MTNTPNIPSTTDISDSVEAEAYAWLAQMDGDNFSEQDLTAFQEWANRSPSHAKAISEINGFWGDLNVLTEMTGTIEKYDRSARHLRHKMKAVKLRRKTFASVLSLAVVVAVFSFANLQRSQLTPHVIETAAVHMPTIYKTSIGEQQEHTLPDGSTITLNTNSHIEVDFRKDQRRIRLLQGEVLFDVAHDTSRPFLVFAGDGIVRAVGTTFVVHFHNDLIDVIVSEGAVELSSVVPTPAKPSSKSTPTKIASLGIVKAGNAAKFESTKASITTISKAEISAKLSWQNGLITFSGETLEEVVREIGRYTELEIEISDPSLKTLRLGGVFRSGDTDALFATLKANFSIIAETSDSGGVTLTKAH